MKFADLTQDLVLMDQNTPYRLTIIEKINHRSVDTIVVSLWRPGRSTIRTEVVQDWEWDISGTKFMNKWVVRDHGDMEQIFKLLLSCNEISPSNA